MINEKGNINYFQVLKAAIVLSLLLVGYMYISQSIIIPLTTVYYILMSFVCLIAFSILHTSLLEVKRIFKSLIVKFHEDYQFSLSMKDIQFSESISLLYLLPLNKKLLCVFRC
jgi:high-affinity Fe2+/Pb2+ permease